MVTEYGLSSLNRSALFLKNPLLLLKRDGQFFNDFGKELIKIHYSADGGDYEAIERFIIDVVLGENDKNREKRDGYFFCYPHAGSLLSIIFYCLIQALIPAL